MGRESWKEEYLKLKFPIKCQTDDKNESLKLFTSNKPSYLFKFRELNERTLEILENSEVWLARADTLNDIHEAKYVLDYDRLLDHARVSPIRNIPPDQLPAHIKDFRSLVIDDYRKSINLCAFSARNDSPVMWAHYANEHKGICIEYEVEKIDGYQEWLHPVIYAQEPVDLTDILLDAIRTMTAESSRGSMDEQKFHSIWEYNKDYLRWPFLKKYIDWQYEDEWRLVKPSLSSDARKGLTHKMPRPSLIYKGIKYGENKSDTKEKFEEICTRNKYITIPMTSTYEHFKIINSTA